MAVDKAIPRESGTALPATRRPAVPRRWTLHGLNNGMIFGATYHGVRTLPRRVSYGIGHVGSWMAWRWMHRSREAIADNLSVVFPNEPREQLERRVLQTYRSYSRDAIDFIRALSTPAEEAHALFELSAEHRALFRDLQKRRRGIVLVTGHYGNWEAGAILISRVLDLPMTIVAMAEADPTVNRIRHRIRTDLGVQTIEVRQSLDTPLQIRRRLAENHIVAMLVDRHYGRDRVAVTMFGRQAWFLRSPLLIAHASGAPLVPCFVERRGVARFAPIPLRPIFVRHDLPPDAAIRSAAQQVADALADRVRAHPEFWYQFYRYWDAQHDAYGGLD